MPQSSSESRYRALFECANEGIVILDADSGLIEEANPAFCRLIGHTAPALNGRPMFDLHPPEQGALLAAYLEAVRTGRELSFRDVAFLRADGSRFTADVNCAPMHLAGRNLIAALVSDVSVRVEALRLRTEELARAEVRARAMLRTMLDGVIHIDRDGTILSVNDAALALFGYEEDELTGRNVRMLVPEPHRSAHDGYIRRYLETRESHIVGSRREVQGLRRDGSLIKLDLLLNEMVDDAGSTFIGLVRDISEHKATMRALEDALSSAQAASESRSRFLANMSHEIRTPINAVLGFSQLCLRAVELPPRGRDYLEKIRLSAESLLGVVNDILDFSKIEAGKLTMEHIPFSLDEVLERVAGLFNQKAREKGLEFAIGAQSGVPRRLLGDPLRLGQVLTNLVGNALKFTERGEIDLLVEPQASHDGLATLRFTVRDTGIGISEAQRATLFSAFCQADSSTTRRFGGTGLGLAISRQLIERMGGSLDVYSQPGQGSAFTFTASFGAVDALPDVPALAHSVLAGKRVLVVEDNAIMLTLLSQSLAAFGCTPVGAVTGEAALEQMRQHADIAAILMDWRLPALDGLAATRRLRERGLDLPIILITGDEPEVARSLARDGDIQAFLAKPVSRSRLHDTLVDALSGQGERPPALHPCACLPELAGYRVLLVDDNEFNRQVGRELVELTQAVVTTAEDGAQAVAICEQQEFDLVLMDIQMPVMDGLTAARILRERHPDLPILALTAHAMVEERARALEAGMNDLLTKPILPDRLHAALAQWLRRESSGFGAVPVAPAEAPLVAIDVPDTAVLDLAAGLVTANGDGDFLARMWRMFAASPAGDLTALAGLIESGDFAQARRQAHSLKGMAASIGAQAVQAVMRDLESALKQERAAAARDLLPLAQSRLLAARAAITRHLEGE